MTFDEYQKRAMTTAVYPKQHALAYTALGLAGEAGEVANKVAKIFRDRDGKPSNLDADNIFGELGDCCWLIAALAHEFGWRLEDIVQHNLRKLDDRKYRGTLGGSGDDR
jgi:NTP pyrophosphatase (non-canonical NTP hydrolase)